MFMVTSKWSPGSVIIEMCIFNLQFVLLLMAYSGKTISEILKENWAFVDRCFMLIFTGHFSVISAWILMQQTDEQTLCKHSYLIMYNFYS